MLLTKVVGRLAPFQEMVEPGTKLAPVTVSVMPSAPAVADVGSSANSAGVGLATMNVRAPETPPPGAGLTTVSEINAALPRSLAGIAT